MIKQPIQIYSFMLFHFYNQKMFYEVIIVVALVILWLINKLYIQPLRLISFYQKRLKNFKVHKFEYTPLGASEFTHSFETAKITKDFFSCAKQKISKFDVSIANIGWKIEITLISPQLICAFYQVDQQKLYKKYDVIRGFKMLIGNAVTFAHGQEWKTKRKIITKTLNFNYIQRLVPKITQISLQKINYSLSIKNKKQFNDLNLLSLTLDIASTIVLELFFGGSNLNVSTFKIDGYKINYYLRDILDLVCRQSLDPVSFILGQEFIKLGLRKIDKELVQKVNNFNKFTKNFVEDRLQQIRKQNPSSKEQDMRDIIETFYIEMVIKNKQKITPKLVQEIINDFSNLYASGTIAISHTAMIAIYYIIKHPQVLKKLQQQIQTEIGLLQDLNYQKIKNCIYIQAVLIETCRLYNAVKGLFPRQAVSDHILRTEGGVEIPIKKGTIVNTNVMTTHYKQEIFSNPKQFNPERFIQDGKIINPEPFTMMTFSFGARSCIGKQLSFTQMKVLLIVMFSRYEVVVEDSQAEMVLESMAYELKNANFKIRQK